MLLAHPAALALNIPPKTSKSARYFSQLRRVPADHNLPLWQWNMLWWALSNFFLFHHTLGTLHFIDPHFLWNSSSSYEVLCLYPIYCPSKLPEKYSPSCIILFVLQFQGHSSSTPSLQNIAYPSPLRCLLTFLSIVKIISIQLTLSVGERFHYLCNLFL